MKEKKFLRWLLTWTAVILVSYIAVSQIMSLVMDNVFEDQLINLTNEYSGAEAGIPLDEDKYELQVDDPDGLVNILALEQRDDRVYLVVEPAKKASGHAYIMIVDKETGWGADAAALKITKRGLIVDTSNGNFTHCREQQLCIVITVIALTLLLLIGYFRSIRDLRFSYQSIFCIGLGIWGTMVSILMLIRYLMNDFMINFYSRLAAAANNFLLITFPFILVFAVLLSISNISLIRHEGFRMRNALGIILSVVMLGGFVFLEFFSNIFSSGYQVFIDIWTAFSRLFITAYAILECFLIGSIICGIRAAKHTPSYDKDYLVILGCMIRKDGTLYPLIRGRVDRAIRFYNEQLAATGKKAVFVPSGGKGSNEPIAEAEAMKNYLLEQGIPAEQILAEDRSKNTRQNMEFSKALIGSDATAAFSTTNFHVFRSGIIAGQVGFDADGMGSPTKWYFWPNAFIREVIGMLSYKWKALVVLFIPIAAFLAVITIVF